MMFSNARRLRAEAELNALDARLAHYYLVDGLLSLAPLAGPPTEQQDDFRARRLRAVATLEAAGGHDPAPGLLRIPTEAQRRGYRERRRQSTLP